MTEQENKVLEKIRNHPKKDEVLSALLKMQEGGEKNT